MDTLTPVQTALEGSASGQRIARRLLRSAAPAVIFVAIFAVYWLTYDGNFGYVTDGYVTFTEAQMLVSTGRFALPSKMGRSLAGADGNAVPYVKQGQDGQYYSKYGPGMSLAEAPLIWMGTWVFPTRSREVQTRMFLSLLSPALVAADALVLLWTVSALGYSLARAGFLAFGFAFTTFVWPYTSYDYSEPLQALCIGAALLCVVRWRRSDRLWLLALAGLCTAFAAATKATLFAAAPWIAAYVLMRSREPRRLRSAIFYCLPVALMAVLLGWFNYERFGWALDFGYNAKETFSTPFLTGFFGLSLSINKGILFFAPLSVLAPFGAFAMRRQWAPEIVLITGICLTNLLLYSSWWAWQGGLSWGPRFLLPVIGALLVLAAPALDRPALKKAAVLLAMAGFVINGSGALIHDKIYMNAIASGLQAAGLEGQSGGPTEWASVVPEFSQISGHLWLLAAFVYGQAAGTGLSAENVVYEAPPWIERFPQIVPQPTDVQVFLPGILRR